MAIAGYKVKTEKKLYYTPQNIEYITPPLVMMMPYVLGALLWAAVDNDRKRLAISVNDGLDAGFGAQHCSINFLHSGSQ